MKGDHCGEFEELVLLVVHALGTDAHRASVRRLLERETTRSISTGAVYAALERLEHKGLVISAIHAGATTIGGRRRKVFTLSIVGTRTLASLRRLRTRLYHARPARARA
jgi:PadR family transcriptional regulator PadR